MAEYARRGIQVRDEVFRARVRALATRIEISHLNEAEQRAARMMIVATVMDEMMAEAQDTVH